MRPLDAQRVQTRTVVTVTAVHGDITEQCVDAVVNAANRQMRGGGGVDGAIHRAGGRAILDDCIARFPRGLSTGDAGWTTAGALPATWVIHTVGPNHAGGERDRSLLESCYRRSLEVADELGAESLAFPLISAGIYAWPLNDAIDAAVDTIHRTPSRVEEVRIVSFTAETHRRVHAQVLRRFPPPTEPDTIGRLFDRSPSQWGLRGDPYLWRALRAELATTPLPPNSWELQDTIHASAAGILGTPLTSAGEPIHVSEFDPGHGMSAGAVLPSWWKHTGIRILIDRYEATATEEGDPAAREP